MALTASLWNGQAIDPQTLIRAFGLKITKAPAGKAWRLVHIGYSHGRNRLRAVFTSGAQPGATWTTNAGLNIYVPVENGESAHDVNTGSYYSPDHAEGPWQVDPDGPSDIVRGIGMAIGIQPQPSAEEDNRYLCPVLYFAWTDEADNSTPSEPTPPTVPVDGMLLTPEEAFSLRASANNIDSIVATATNRRPV